MEDRTTTKKKKLCGGKPKNKNKTPAVGGVRNPATKITLPQAVGGVSSL